MITNLTKEDLINFENKIANLFNEGKIRAPIHLQSNCFDQLIDIFNHINENDWILGSWRFHAETLLKGVPEKELVSAILNGKSISLSFPKYRTFCSAIVTGCLPIGVGISIGIKRKSENNKVYVFCGEMTAMTGAFYECVNYCTFHDLPIIFVVSDNGKSVCTDTRKTWNTNKLSYEPNNVENNVVHKTKHIWYYKYDLTWPHAGSGKRIEF